jgi:Na+/proline symporter
MSTVAIVSYFAVGGGKFIAEFLGIPGIFGLTPEYTASLVMISLAMIYTVASGLQGVVWTDVFQGVFIMITIIIVCLITVTNFSLPEKFAVSVPMTEGGFELIDKTRGEWTRILPRWELGMPASSSYSIYNLFGITILFYIIKTTIEGSGGMGGYMVQRYFAAKSDREAGLLSLLWIALLSFRWPFIISLAIMAISYGASTGKVIEDPERVLPVVINEIIPIGLKGLLFAGLISAAMSTFDSIINSGASYWVRDIYQVVIKRDADPKRLIFQSRAASIILVVVGLILTFFLESINEIWGWLTMGIGAGMIVPLLVRWYWWRLNGYGFAAGIASGMLTAIAQKLLFPDAAEYYSFLTVSISSFCFMILITLLTRPTHDSVLIDFYSLTKPFGIWGKIKKQLGEEVKQAIARETKFDILSLLFAVPWQLVLFLTGMMLIIQKWFYFTVLLVLLLFLSAGLYFFWYRKLSSVEREA